ncbi:MAG: hypothetical protein GVY30_06035 [Chloroflexi bacterium]|jgi:hypothetical protein|nr:hypothetical protein [Chloroflexota bacterium]
MQTNYEKKHMGKPVDWEFRLIQGPWHQEWRYGLLIKCDEEVVCKVDGLTQTQARNFFVELEGVARNALIRLDVGMPLTLGQRIDRVFEINKHDSEKLSQFEAAIKNAIEKYGF